MNNFKIGSTTENVRKHRDIKLVTTIERRDKLASRPNYHATKCFSENILTTELSKTEVKMDKSVYLGLPVLDMIT